jgi:hypothetical protein
MKPNTQTLESLRVQLDLQAIADREGITIAEVQARAQAGEDEFIRDWIAEHFFDLGGF